MSAAQAVSSWKTKEDTECRCGQGSGSYLSRTPLPVSSWSTTKKNCTTPISRHLAGSPAPPRSRPSPSWSPLFGGRQCAALSGRTFLGRRGSVRSPTGALDGLLPAGSNVHMVLRGYKRPGIVLLSSPIPDSRSEQWSHLPYTPRDQLR